MDAPETRGAKLHYLIPYPIDLFPTSVKEIDFLIFFGIMVDSDQNLEFIYNDLAI